MDAELLIRGGQVADGDGPIRRVDVAVKDHFIAAVSADLPTEGCREVINADGLLLTPGFIDMHTHSALMPFEDPTLEPKIAQGFTTEVICPDGLAPAPVRDEQREDRRAYLQGLERGGPPEWDWTHLDGFLDRLAQTLPTTTLVPSAPHGAIREYVLGTDNRAPSRTELAEMQALVRDALDAGARMLSFGLVYLPGLFASTEELEALAEVAAVRGVPLTPHVRNEAGLLLEAIDEFVGIARRTGAPLHLSHLKVIDERLLDGLLELLDSAADEVDLSFDQYPYGAGSTGLTALLPPWALEGGPRRMLDRVTDPNTRASIASDIADGLPGWENLFAACGPENIAIASAGGPNDQHIGRMLAEIANDQGCDAVTAMLDLLQSAELNVTMVNQYAGEHVIRAIFAHPAALVGTDGIFAARPHPRLYGTAPRVLGRYAMRERLVSVEEAVARLTSRAADRLGLSDRGRVREGLRADLVLLDPSTFIDTATYERPQQVPPGVVRIVVAGETVWEGGHATGARPGGVVRTPMPTTSRPSTND